MAIAPFLAMTAAEIHAASSLPSKIAWMACHFSPYGMGLSNLPKTLPDSSLLILDDFTPPQRHDPGLITDQLLRCVEAFHCHGVLLDFQRCGCDETKAIAAYLTEALTCPVAVSRIYAGDLDCPVFLPPLPPSEELEGYLHPWADREVWMELGLDGEIITLAEEAAESMALPYPDLSLPGFADEHLHCHYKIETNKKSARFALWRTKEDLQNLLEEAHALGITTAVGLYQELHITLPSGTQEE